MLGQSSKVSAARDKDRQATIPEQTVTEDAATHEKASLAPKQVNDAASGLSTSSPLDPPSSLPTTTAAGDANTKSVYSHGKASSKRYKTYYSKPTLLKLWKSNLSVNAVLDELYSAFEVRVRLFFVW